MTDKPKTSEAVHLLRSIQTELRGLRRDLRAHFKMRVEEEAKSMVKGSMPVLDADMTADYVAKQFADAVDDPVKRRQLIEASRRELGLPKENQGD